MFVSSPVQHPLDSAEFSQLWDELPKRLCLKEAIKAVSKLNGRYQFSKPGVDNRGLLPLLSRASGKWVVEFGMHCVVYDADKQLVYECDISYPACGIHVSPEALTELGLSSQSITKCYKVTLTGKSRKRKRL
jgi:hypothetical protein